MWSPAPHNCIKVGVFPIPEADTFAVSVLSIAIALSKYKLLGEEWREYNNLPYCLQRYQT
jgi:hypothetical protein